MLQSHLTADEIRLDFRLLLSKEGFPELDLDYD